MGLLIGEIVTTAALTVPGAVAATLGTGRLTFAELDERANRTANALAGLGIRRGDRILWWATPTLRALDVFVGCARLGATFAPVNPQLPPPEMAGIGEYLRARLLITNLDADSGTGLPMATVDGDGQAVPGHNLDALTAAASGHPPAGHDRLFDGDPHIVYLTSGSTGRPKGVLVSHRASWLRAAPGGGTFASGLRGDGGVVCTFPLYHYGGWHYVMEAWQHRTAVHLVRRADAIELVDVVQRRRPTALYCIPAVWERLLDPMHRAADLSSLRHADTGTSGVSTELVERIKRRLPGTTTTILYGSTEAGRMAALQDWDLARKPGSVGRPAFPGALWLADDGEPAHHAPEHEQEPAHHAPEHEQEICLRGPTLMSGYHDLPAETASVLRDGVYHSGDLGQIDDEGYLYLTGRTREVIRTGGETVGPAEVEQALHDMPGVCDVAVVGLPDERWGEIVCAVFVLPAGATAPDVGAVRDHVAGRLAGFKRPRRIAVVPAIPRTPATGQIQRGTLRAELLAGKRG